MTTIDDAPRALLPEAAKEFGDRVHAVPPDHWAHSTPDAGWSVHDLVNHVVSEHLWVPPLLAGRTIDEVGDRFDGDVLGGDPVKAWDEAIAASLAAWSRVHDERTVHLSNGPTPAGEYANQMLLDLVVHAWDLARGAELPDDRLPDHLVRHVYDYVEPVADGWRACGIFGPPIPTTSPDPQHKLLALLGRHP